MVRVSSDGNWQSELVAHAAGSGKKGWCEMVRKEIAIHQLLAYRRCPAMYAAGKHKRKDSTGSVMGRAVHAIAAGEDEHAVLAKAAHKLRKLEKDEAKVSDVLCSAQVMGRKAAAAATPGSARERQLVYDDFETSWRIFAKLDELPTDDRVKTIVDIKSGRRLHHGCWDQLFEFGLVLSLVDDYWRPIRLKLRCCPNEGEPVEYERWFSPKLVDSQLEKLHETIRQIESSHESGVFPHKPGSHCSRCPLADTCEANRLDRERHHAADACLAAA